VHLPSGTQNAIDAVRTSALDPGLRNTNVTLRLEDKPARNVWAGLRRLAPPPALITRLRAWTIDGIKRRERSIDPLLPLPAHGAYRFGFYIDGAKLVRGDAEVFMSDGDGSFVRLAALPGGGLRLVTSRLDERRLRMKVRRRNPKRPR